MQRLPSILLSVILAALAVMAIFSLVRSLLQAIKVKRVAGYVPVPEIYPPVPIVPGAGAKWVGFSALAWGGLHLVLAGIWAVSSWPAPHTTDAVVVAAYGSVASGMMAVGGVMFLLCQPFGRKMVAWGELLLGVLAFLGMAVAIMLPGFEQAPPEVRRSAPYVAIGLFVYLVIGTAIGSLSQVVARSPEPRQS